MALSNDLSKLAARSKDAETHTAEAADKARTHLEHEVSAARASAEAQAESLRGTAAAHDADVANWWIAVRQSWNEHVAKAHEADLQVQGKYGVSRARSPLQTPAGTRGTMFRRRPRSSVDRARPS